MSEIVVIFTCKTRKDIMEVGGAGWWKIDPTRVTTAGRVLLVHNANDPRQRGDQDRHGQAFLSGTVRHVRQDEDGRWLIQFEEYAEVEGSFRWPGYRNPVAYMDADEVLGSVEAGEWQRMPEVGFPDAQAARRAWDAARGGRKAPSAASGSRSFGAVIEEHRQHLAEELGVDPQKVRIVIEA